jgi:hypothetical protein
MDNQAERDRERENQSEKTNRAATKQAGLLAKGLDGIDTQQLGIVDSNVKGIFKSVRRFKKF